MCKTEYVQIVLDMGCDLRCILTCTSTGSVRHTDVRWIQLCDLIRRTLHICKPRIRLRWEHLKRYIYSVFIQSVNDLHLVVNSFYSPIRLL